MRLRTLATRLALLVAFLAPVTLTCAIDYANLATQYLAKLEHGIANAKEHRDAPQWWGQCEIDFKGLEENTAQLPPDQRAAFLAKIQLCRPQVEAGVRLYHASIVARHIRDALDSAREDLKTGPVADRTLEALARFFADKDLQGLPADDLKKLRADYEDVKKRSAGK
ncbi:MAG: hypothetical protein P4L99_02435 [Chthoniobacter sp.]|nr:hypothetical protein [Chthoniobacter sp.]